VFKIVYPADYALGIDEKWVQKYRIWVDRTPDQLFIIYARCTHLACIPDWKPAENKFKCPCHGSGYDSEGINFEGPAPRPMDRAHFELAPDGQILVDVARLLDFTLGRRASGISLMIPDLTCLRKCVLSQETCLGLPDEQVAAIHELLMCAGQGNPRAVEGDELPPEWRKKPGRKAANERDSAKPGQKKRAAC
jgi:nitrite reductase/ring-hydroxylating ferredoxin subunit